MENKVHRQCLFAFEYIFSIILPFIQIIHYTKTNIEIKLMKFMFVFVFIVSATRLIAFTNRIGSFSFSSSTFTMILFIIHTLRLWNRFDIHLAIVAIRHFPKNCSAYSIQHTAYHGFSLFFKWQNRRLHMKNEIVQDP